MISPTSLSILKSVHPDLQKVIIRASAFLDLVVQASSVRTKEEQIEYVKTGKSKTLTSLHFLRPWAELGGIEYTAAVDIAPQFKNKAGNWTIDWNNKERFNYMGGFIIGISELMYLKGDINHRLRWGGDWNKNANPSDENFYDGPHFELTLD